METRITGFAKHAGLKDWAKIKLFDRALNKKKKNLVETITLRSRKKKTTSPIVTALVGGAAAGTAAGSSSALVRHLLSPNPKIEKKAGSYAGIEHAKFDFSDDVHLGRTSTKSQSGTTPGGLVADGTQRPTGPSGSDPAGFHRHVTYRGGSQTTDRSGYSLDKFPIIKTLYGD
jgi:hypothetical protein